MREDAANEVQYEDGQAYQADVGPGRQLIALPVVGGYAFTFKNEGREPVSIALTCDTLEAMALLAHHIDKDRAPEQFPLDAPSSIILPA